MIGMIDALSIAMIDKQQTKTEAKVLYEIVDENGNVAFRGESVRATLKGIMSEVKKTSFAFPEGKYFVRIQAVIR